MAVTAVWAQTLSLITTSPRRAITNLLRTTRKVWLLAAGTSTSDLPLATNGSVGAISAGSEFAVTPAGELQIDNQVTAAGHASPEYNERGLITSGRDLADTDIPDLDATKIQSGVFTTDYLDENSVTERSWLIIQLFTSKKFSLQSLVMTLLVSVGIKNQQDN